MEKEKVEDDQALTRLPETRGRDNTLMSVSENLSLSHDSISSNTAMKLLSLGLRKAGGEERIMVGNNTLHS